jgi:UDP-N-acetylglucosamine--N-acetylmuramyl-(pentapeptide) pyrophosphoryl-undecaprenol N-acetylglucosamine transferase
MKSREFCICLAGSGGGHVRQLLDLEGAWSPHNHFFVSEDSALSRSIAERHRTYFLPHFAWGQARLGSPVRMLVAALNNFIQSAKIIFKERPQLVITTGAGAVFGVSFWARLLGANVIVIESFARFNHLSKFARIAGPLAQTKVVQSKHLKRFWPDAALFDPLRILSDPPPEKKPLMFVTVGATLPFDRMVSTVAALHTKGKIPETIFIQTGVGGLAPPGIETVETLPFDQIMASLNDAAIVVCHGGTGSLVTALRMGCRVVAMPRLSQNGEHYDDHQAEITKAFADRGLIAVANTPEELEQALADVRSRPPVRATTDHSSLVAYLNGLIAEFRNPLGARPQTQT